MNDCRDDDIEMYDLCELCDIRFETVLKTSDDCLYLLGYAILYHPNSVIINAEGGIEYYIITGYIYDSCGRYIDA